MSRYAVSQLTECGILIPFAGRSVLGGVYIHAYTTLHSLCTEIIILSAAHESHFL